MSNIIKYSYILDGNCQRNSSPISDPHRPKPWLGVGGKGQRAPPEKSRANASLEKRNCTAFENIFHCHLLLLNKTLGSVKAL